MIITWYLIRQFLQTFFLAILSFIGITLTTRLDEIAHFAASGAPIASLLEYCLYQVPYILPIVIPISCLIASILLVQRLSSTQELTALRASGYPLKKVITPLLVVSFFLALLNFYIVSEVATESHLSTRRLENNFRAFNPLTLLQNRQLSQLKDISVYSFSPHLGSEMARDVVLGTWDKKNRRLHVMLASRLNVNESQFLGKKVTLIGGIEGKVDSAFDPLYLENIDRFDTSLDQFSQYFKKRLWRKQHNDYLRMSLLRAHKHHVQKELREAVRDQAPPEKLRHLRKQIQRVRSEISRRFSLAIAVLTFTLMGAAFGMTISRTHSSTGVYTAIGLTTLFLVSFFTAKGMESNFYLSTALYFLPHMIIIAFSIHALKRISRGVES